MSIRLKIVAVVLAVAVLLFVALVVISNVVVLASYQQLEQQNTERNVERVVNALNDELAVFQATNADWAHWDATYDYMLGDYPDYAESELGDDVIANLNLNLIALLTTDGEVIYGTGFDLEAGESVPLPDAFEFDVLWRSPLLEIPDDSTTNSGFVLIGDQLVMASASPVLTSAKQGPSVGTMMMGRYIDESRIIALSESLRMDVTAYPLGAAALPQDVAAAMRQIQAPDAESGIVTTVMDGETIAGYAVLYGPTGAPVAALRIEQDRSIYIQGMQTVLLQGLLLLISGLLLGSVVMISVERMVISRVTRLSREVDQVDQVGDSTQRVTAKGDDEIASLASDINHMLTRLDDSNRLLAENNTALKLAYEQAQEATRLKSEFLSTMSHELRTPLNTIIGYAGIMLEGIGGEIDQEAQRMIKNINDSGEHLLTLINAILDLSKIEAGRMELVEEDIYIRELIDRLQTQMAVLALKKHIQFNTRIAPEVPEIVRGDESRIAQVVINLLSNALKFTEQGGVTLNVTWKDEQLVISVEDTGIGIPPHALNYIFDEFRQVDGSTRRNHGGTGLGLAIVRKLLKTMGGSISVESEVGRGSTFTAVMPLTPVMEPAVAGS